MTHKFSTKAVRLMALPVATAVFALAGPVGAQNQPNQGTRTDSQTQMRNEAQTQTRGQTQTRDINRRGQLGDADRGDLERVETQQKRDNYNRAYKHYDTEYFTDDYPHYGESYDDPYFPSYDQFGPLPDKGYQRDSYQRTYGPDRSGYDAYGDQRYQPYYRGGDDYAPYYRGGEQARYPRRGDRYGTNAPRYDQRDRGYDQRARGYGGDDLYGRDDYYQGYDQGYYGYYQDARDNDDWGRRDRRPTDDWYEDNSPFSEREENEYRAGDRDDRYFGSDDERYYDEDRYDDDDDLDDDDDDRNDDDD